VTYEYTHMLEHNITLHWKGLAVGKHSNVS
jgi:hypothetical protein